METSSFFTKNGFIDGIGRYTQNIYTEIQQDSSVTVQGVCLPLEIDKEKAVKEKQIIIEGLPFKFDLLKSLVFTSSYEPYFSQYDLLFLPDFYRIPIVKNIPMIATIHDSIPLSHPEWVYSTRAHRLKNNFRLKYTASLLDRIICISEFAANDVMEHFGIPENKIDIIYHGIDQKFFQPVDSEIKRGILEKYNLLSKKYILHVSTLQPRKNQLRILDAYEKLPKSLKEEYPLVMVGKNGWGCDDVVEKLQQLEKNNTAKWLNNITDEALFALYQESTCFVFPSLYEGFGFPILEAMASNTPVITSNLGAMKEIAGENNAYLVDPYSADELSDAMKNLLQNSLLRNKFIELGRIHAGNFTWERSAQEHIKVFKKMV